jgi:hypothetical protein
LFFKLNTRKASGVEEIMVLLSNAAGSNWGLDIRGERERERERERENHAIIHPCPW